MGSSPSISLVSRFVSEASFSRESLLLVYGGGSYGRTLPSRYNMQKGETDFAPKRASEAKCST